MKKIILTVFFLSASIYANANSTKELKVSCEEYAHKAARAEVIYYGDWDGYSRLYSGWLSDCNNYMDGDATGWGDPMFCDNSCWPS